MNTSPRSFVLWVSLLLAACDEGGGSVADASCSTGERWSGGGASPLMHPGRDCVTCHAGNGGPNYDALDERNDCFGVADVLVQLIGADGKKVELHSNDAGSFARGKVDLALPYTVRLEYEGRERFMTTPQTQLDCASCHGATGKNGAPGRILVP